MGTPKDTDRRELTTPTIAEKIKALALGRQIGQEFKLVDSLTQVLEEVREIILPLVQWLDKPLTEIWRPALVSAHFQKKRAMTVCSRFFIIALGRQGKWIFSFPPSDKNLGQMVKEGDSARLAEAISEKLDGIWRKILGYQAEKEFDRMLAKPQTTESPDLHFVVDLFRYNALLTLLSNMSETIDEALVEREKRLCLMRERLAFLGDFSASLDPLLAKGSTLEFPAYFIWDEYVDEDGHGHTSRSTSDYLCPEALAPYKEILKSRQLSSYKERASGYSFESLKWVCDRIDYLLSEVEAERSARDLFGTNHGRLPLIPKEIQVLKTVCSSFMSSPSAG